MIKAFKKQTLSSSGVATFHVIPIGGLAKIGWERVVFKYYREGARPPNKGLADAIRGRDFNSAVSLRRRVPERIGRKGIIRLNN